MKVAQLIPFKSVISASIALFIVIVGINVSHSSEKIFKDDVFYEDEGSQSRKSVWSAVGLSILLPGAGELYLGHKNSAIIPLITEGIILTSAASFATFALWKEDEYRSFAAKYAGIDNTGKDEEFYRLITLWESRDLYNYYLLLTERDEDILLPQNSEWFWEWRNDEDQLEFYDRWTSAERGWRNFRISLAAAGVNRLISVINVLRLSRMSSSKWQISAKSYPIENDLGFSISVSRDIDLP